MLCPLRFLGAGPIFSQGGHNPDLRTAGTAVAHSGARPPRDHGDMARMRYYWTWIPNGQLLGALRNARFTRTLRLKALTTSRLRHGPRVHGPQNSNIAREGDTCVGPKKYRSFPRRYSTDHAPLVNYRKVMKTCARAKDQCFFGPKGSCACSLGLPKVQSSET